MSYYTPTQSAAVTMDYLLTAFNRYGMFNAAERKAFWEQAQKSSLTTEDLDNLRKFLGS
jgi:hypothetical protein